VNSIFTGYNVKSIFTLHKSATIYFRSATKSCRFANKAPKISEINCFKGFFQAKPSIQWIESRKRRKMTRQVLLEAHPLRKFHIKPLNSSITKSLRLKEILLYFSSVNTKFENIGLTIQRCGDPTCLTS
jgi:hypothetical protein